MAQSVSTPLRRLRPPGYPTKLAARAEPALLRDLPPAWRSQREIAALAGVLLSAGTAGCEKTAALDGAATGRSARVAAVVAPVFEHGEGRVPVIMGAIGGPIETPVESDALRLVREELERAGLKMSERNIPLDSVNTSHATWHLAYDWVADRPASRCVDVPMPLVIDLRDSERHVAVELVTRGNIYLLQGCDEPGDVKQVAEAIAEQVRRQGHDVYFGAFYEPVGELNYEPPAAVELAWNVVEATHTEEERASALAQFEKISDAEATRVWDEQNARRAEDLRQQVKDFVDWLKAQGVI